MEEAASTGTKRKNRWDTGAAVPPTVDLAAAAIAARDAAAAAATKQVADAQRAIQQQAQPASSDHSSLHQPSLRAEPAAPKPPTVTLDSQGRLLDERGKVIKSTPRPQASIKINQTARVNPLLKAMQEARETAAADSKYHDPRMAPQGQMRDQVRIQLFSECGQLYSYFVQLYCYFVPGYMVNRGEVI